MCGDFTWEVVLDIWMIVEIVL